MDADEFDPLTSTGTPSSNRHASQRLGATNTETSEKARMLIARQDAFRSIADRFYMLWWNLPTKPARQIDHEIVDMFRMFMELAPSLGVSQNGIPELKECCGRKRDPFDGEIDVDLTKSISGARQIESPFRDVQPIENLGWCPGDLIRRITRFLGFKFCQDCDQRRRKINAFFWCGEAK